MPSLMGASAPKVRNPWDKTQGFFVFNVFRKFSSGGRAPLLQGGCRRFNSYNLHQVSKFIAGD